MAYARGKSDNVVDPPSPPPVISYPASPTTSPSNLPRTEPPNTSVDESHMLVAFLGHVNLHPSYGSVRPITPKTIGPPIAPRYTSLSPSQAPPPLPTHRDVGVQVRLPDVAWWLTNTNQYFDCHVHWVLYRAFDVGPTEDFNYVVSMIENVPGYLYRGFGTVDEANLAWELALDAGIVAVISWVKD